MAESKTGKKQTGGGKPMPTTPLARSGTVALQSTRIGLTQSQTVTLTKGGTLVPGVTGYAIRCAAFCLLIEVCEIWATHVS